MKNLFFLFFSILLIGCKDDQDDSVNILPDENLEIEDFVYKAMNFVYYWQKDVPNLADDKFSNDKEYTTFLQSFEDPTDLFENLKFTTDKYSIIFDDYEEFNRLSQAVSLSNGMSFGLARFSPTDTNIFAYVKYVSPNTDAAQKGIKRGDIFSHVDGNQLSINNYSELLFSNRPSYTIDLATISNNMLQKTGTSVTLTNTQLTERQIHLSNIIMHEGKKVGYVMYNGFTASQENDLQNVFSEFATQQIDELIIDLRYNPGGRVSTSQLLAGLIAGEHAGKVFGKMIFNDKLAAENTQINILNSNINLGLTRVFFLTTQNSASASEMLINGLKPYLTTVQIGDKTEGKNVGSTPIYDFIDNKETKNPNHKWMLLPITFKILNSEDFGDYPEGLQPNIPLPEVLTNLGVLGEINEPLLEKALEIISGQISTSSSLTTNGVSSSFVEIPVKQGKAIYELSKNAN